MNGRVPDRKPKGAVAALSAALGLALAAAAPAQEPTAPIRTEVPIIEVVLSNGVPRYAVPVRVGEREILAGLDTGASGLRLLPDAAAGVARPGTAEETYAYATGTTLSGTDGKAKITIGGLSGEAKVHLVTSTGCQKGREGCPGDNGPAYGFLQHGLKNEGFRAMLGGNMGRTSIDHPLRVVGARRWIIELPRPGEGGRGRLILNPTDEEVSGFLRVRLAGGFREADGGGLHDAVPGCLKDEALKVRVCGLITLDTGAYFVRVLNADPMAKDAWAPGAAIDVELRGPDPGPYPTFRMTAGAEAQEMFFGPAPRRETILQLGTAPYFAYSVLYDPVNNRLGFKPRPPLEGLPQAIAP